VKETVSNKCKKLSLNLRYQSV